MTVRRAFAPSWDLPKGWAWRRIGDIAEVATGGTPDTKRPEYYGGEVNWLKSGDVRGDFIETVPQQISQLGLQNSNARVHPPGSVMLAMSGQGKTRGRSAVMRVPSACSQSVAAILPNGSALPEIINYALNLRYEDIRQATGDGERTGLNLGNVRDIAIPIPPLPEQERIAARLTEQLATVARARAAAEARLAAAEALPGAMLREVFEGSESQGWEREQLGALCDVVRGSSPRPKGDPRYFGGSIPWIMISDVTRANGRFLTQTREFVTTEGMERSRYLEPGALIVSNSATIGLPIFLGVAGCIHDGYLTFLDVDPRLSLDWLYEVFRWVRSDLERIAPQGAQKNLNTGIVSRIAIPLPPLAQQKALCERLRCTDASQQVAAAICNELAEIDALPAALLREAFHGAN